MSMIVVAVGALVAALGLWGMASPPGFIAYARFWKTTWGLGAAVAFRLALGVVFWLAAPESRQPLVLQALAVLSVVAAVGLAIAGRTRFEAMITWGESMSAGLIRVWMLGAVGFGLYLIWVAL